MSGYTGTNPELYYSFAVAGTALATFTTEASLMGLFPVPQIPATFFAKLGNNSSSMKVRAWGQVGCSATAATFTWSVRLLTSGTAWAASAGGGSWSSNAATCTASKTGSWWQMDLDLMLQSIAVQAATSSLVASGPISSDALATPAFIPADNVSSVQSTFDATGATQYFLWLSAACGTSNASNTIRLQGLKIYLEN